MQHCDRMARQILELITDDLNNDEGAEPIQFSYRGIDYELDLAERSQAKMDKALAPFIKAARKVGGRKRSRSSSKSRNDLSSVRAWAREHGHAVSERGRIPAAALEAYDNR
jgi:nucleoid-associated protein Lsr2